ncbi:hypothetical protein LXL04_021321 [Taraxacum kok-saghyz]
MAICEAIPDYEYEENFRGTSKAHASIPILNMLTTKYGRLSGVCQYIMMITDMTTKRKSMYMEINEGFLVHFIMKSIPAQYGPFKINYNTQREN